MFFFQISYPTHEFFFNVRAIYLVVFKIPNLTESNVQYWLRKIKDFGRFSSLLNTPPPIILVGTHLDNSECTPSLLKFVSKVSHSCLISRVTTQKSKNVLTSILEDSRF